MRFEYQRQKPGKKSKVRCGGCQEKFCKGDLKVEFPGIMHAPGSECEYHLDCYKNTFSIISRVAFLEQEMQWTGIRSEDRQNVIDFWSRCDELYRESLSKKRKHDLLLDTDPEVKKAPKSSMFGPFPTDIWENIITFAKDANIVLNIGRTCRDAYELSNLDSIWKRLLVFNIVNLAGVSIFEKIMKIVPQLARFESKPLFVELYRHICRECGVYCTFAGSGFGSSLLQQDFRHFAEENLNIPQQRYSVLRPIPVDYCPIIS